MNTRVITLAAVLSAVVAAAPPAAATELPSTGKDIAYAVEVDGQGTYHYAEHIDGGGTDWHGSDVNLTFDYQAQMGDGVVFRNGSPFDTTADDIPSGHATGT